MTMPPKPTSDAETRSPAATIYAEGDLVWRVPKRPTRSKPKTRSELNKQLMALHPDGLVGAARENTVRLTGRPTL
jgi:hypothetical protein